MPSSLIKWSINRLQLTKQYHLKDNLSNIQINLVLNKNEKIHFIPLKLDMFFNLNFNV